MFSESVSTAGETFRERFRDCPGDILQLTVGCSAISVSEVTLHQGEGEGLRKFWKYFSGNDIKVKPGVT
jgi:hypothetical protein